MKASELFGVIVRTIGFLIVIYGLWEIWGGIENFAENLLYSGQDDNTEQQVSSFSYFAFGVPAFFLGVILFFLADWVVRMTYRNQAA